MTMRLRVAIGCMMAFVNTNMTMKPMMKYGIPLLFCSLPVTVSCVPETGSVRRILGIFFPFGTCTPDKTPVRIDALNPDLSGVDVATRFHVDDSKFPRTARRKYVPGRMRTVVGNLRLDETSMKGEHMLCDVDIDFNADSHAVKLVHVGPIVYGARSRLQSDMNGIGWLAPHFEAVWVTDAITDDMLPSMYYIDEDSETTLDERSCRNAVDLEKLRREIPFNNDVLSCHSMRYEENTDHRLTVARSEDCYCYSVMKYSEIEKQVSLDDSLDPDSSTILGLWDRISGLVIPLAGRNALVVEFHGSGYDVSVDVRDDESLKLLMRRYPHCFSEYPDETTLDRGVEQCEAILRNVISNNINLYTETHPNPNARERKNDNA